FAHFIFRTGQVAEIRSVRKTDRGAEQDRWLYSGCRVFLLLQGKSRGKLVANAEAFEQPGKGCRVRGTFRVSGQQCFERDQADPSGWQDDQVRNGRRYVWK